MESKSRTLDDVVDGLGLGLGQYLIVLFGGELFSGLIKTLVTVTSASFAHDLGFSSFERGWLVSILFLGNFVGNLTSGALSDHCGRRTTLRLGYAVALVSLATACFVTSFLSMLLCRMSFGLAAGLMGPTCWALLGELSPSTHRMWMHSMGHLTWFIGSFTMMLMVHLEDPTMQHLNWRGLTVLVFSVVVVLTLGAILFVVESPSYLCSQGRCNDATSVLETLRSRNGVQLDVRSWDVRHTDTRPSAQGVQSWSYASLFRRSSMFTTLFLCISTFSLNFSSYGMMYALPLILRSSSLNVVPSTTMLVNLTFGLVGLFLSVPASAASHSRLGFLGSVLLARGVCCICFFLGLWYENGSILILTITLLGIFGKTLLDSIAYVLVYLYAVEVQATESRASSSGMALAVGRLGGVLAPVVYEVIPHTPGSFVLVISVLAFVCAALALGLPIETKDRQLGEIAAETAPLPKEAK